MSGPSSDATRPEHGPAHAPGSSVANRARARRTELRESITGAALDLVTSRGLDDVTVDEIARTANVSRRTFFNYFPSKAAACFPGTFPPDKEAVYLFLNDRSVPTLTAVGRLLWRQVAKAHRDNPDFDRFHDMWRREQGVRSEIHAVLARTEADLATLIARRDGCAPDSAESAAVAAAAVAILRIAVEQWRTDESAELLEHRIREAFEAVARATGPEPGSD